jgi:rsbT co-antagonist protein RsbR
MTNLESLQERRAQIRSDAVAILADLKRLDGGQGGTLEIFDEIEDLEDSLTALNADQQQMREEATADVSEEIAAAFLRTLTTVLVASVIVTGMVVGLYFWIRSVIVRPVQALSRAAEQIGAGNYGISMQAGGVAEVGELQRSFTQMAGLLGAREASLAQQVTMIQQAHDQAQRAEQRLTEQLATIERQSETIREMSVSLLPMGESTLVMPLVGILDEARLEMMQTQALERVSRQRTDVLILDVTGVPIIDSQVAQGLISITQSARLLGTKAVLVGIRPEVAQTIVGLGIALDEMSTFASLQDAIRATLRSRAN